MADITFRRSNSTRYQALSEHLALVVRSLAVDQGPDRIGGSASVSWDNAQPQACLSITRYTWLAYID